MIKSIVLVSVALTLMPCSNLLNVFAKMVFRMESSFPRRSDLIVLCFPLLLKMRDMVGLLKYSRVAMLFSAS